MLFTFSPDRQTQPSPPAGSLAGSHDLHSQPADDQGSSLTDSLLEDENMPCRWKVVPPEPGAKHLAGWRHSSSLISPRSDISHSFVVGVQWALMLFPMAVHSKGQSRWCTFSMKAAGLKHKSLPSLSFPLLLARWAFRITVLAGTSPTLRHRLMMLQGGSYMLQGKLIPKGWTESKSDRITSNTCKVTKRCHKGFFGGRLNSLQRDRALTASCTTKTRRKGTRLPWGTFCFPGPPPPGACSVTARQRTLAGRFSSSQLPVLKI